MTNDIILEVKNLSVAFEKETVLEGVSFSLKRGTATAVIGPNGSGKTVLFRALLGLVPYEGDIKWRPGIKIGYVPQKFLIDRGMPLTVKEFFLLKNHNFWLSAPSFRKHLVKELGLFGLAEDILRRPVADLSGGQLQRILITWAMLDHPDILLFDEPTAGVDIGAEETIYSLIHRLQEERGTAILLVSHDLNVVYRYTNDVICINKQMVCYGPPRQVLTPGELTKLYGESGFYHHQHHQSHHLENHHQ